MHSVKWPRHIYAASINNLQKMDHIISFEELFKNILGRQSEHPKFLICFSLIPAISILPFHLVLTKI